MCLNLLRLFQAIQVNLRNRSDGLNRILHRIPPLPLKQKVPAEHQAELMRLSSGLPVQLSELRGQRCCNLGETGHRRKPKHIRQKPTG